MFVPESLTALLLAVAVLAAMLRLLWQRRDLRSAVLAAATLASGVLLYFALFPPHLPVGGETLLVATAETPPDLEAKPGERLVALPEAPRISGAERVPDLATALRRHEQIESVRIVGRGLSERDRDIDTGLETRFDPMDVPRGLTRLDPPRDTPAGSVFTVGGQVNGYAGGTVELLDPAGRRVDRRTLGGEGRFTMGGTARAPGIAIFTLRLRGEDSGIVSDTPVPLRTVAEARVRALLVGVPSPEVKYLRRWAEDSGIELDSALDAGGGVGVGDAGVTLNAGVLRERDVVIIDDRSLQALGGGSRAALSGALANGLGVVVRMTAPASEGARRSWRGLGLAVDGGSEVEAIALPPVAPDADTLLALRGPGAGDVPVGLNAADDPVPELGRWAVRAGPDFVTAVSDADGGMLSGWQQRQQGRVALWTVANSFALVLNGQPERYYQWWSDTVSPVVRPARVFRPDVPALPVAGERMSICGLTGPAQVIGPDGRDVALAIDPGAGATGCAAYWPASQGEHTIARTIGGETSQFAFHVFSADAFAGQRARELGEATTRWAASQNARGTRTVPKRRGAAWPWLLAWLLVSGALWFGERRWLVQTVPTT